MLHFGMLRKYTLGLLSTFNDIEIEYALTDDTTETKKIPITFSSKEKSTFFNELDTKQLLAGNYNVLPRMSLVLSTMVKSEQRTTNKFNKINSKNNGDDTSTYTYNSVPYEFTYELVIQCRGMNEASMIIEQIAPRFNPNYTMRINETPNSTEATSVPISLLDIGIDMEEFEEISTNLVTINIGIGLKGNLYPPLQTSSVITNVEIFNNLWPTDEFERASLIQWDVVDTLPVNISTDVFTEKVSPTISDILGIFEIGTSDVTVIYEDNDNKYEEMIFVWEVTSGDATITSGSDTVQLTVNSGITVTITCVITDIHGNTSGTFTKIL